MSRPSVSAALIAAGAVAFAFALLSIVDILVPRPYDGVVLQADARGEMRVRELVPGSGADEAGILPGDRIAGIDRTVLRSTEQAEQILAKRRIGQVVPYLVHRGDKVLELEVRLGRRFVGSASYFFACLLGFAFFAIGLFVVLRRPELRAAQVFYLVGALFLLFLVCRLRPASYGWIEVAVVNAGGIALELLPAAFLHFFLIFPRPLPLRPNEGDPDFARRRRRWLGILTALYLIPVATPLVVLGMAWRSGEAPRLINGAPEASWWVFGLYMALGLVALGTNARRLADANQRRGARMVLAGALFGLIPFLGVAFLHPEWLYLEPQAFAALGPLALVPLTFAFAIIRFGLLDIRILLRRSLVYTLVTIAVTAVYAVVLTLVNGFAVGSRLAASPWFPVLFALAIIGLLEPLRRSTQRFVDGFVLGDRRRLQQEVRELGRAIAGQLDPQPVVRDLVERLPQLLNLHYAALYLLQEGRLRREAGPASLPDELDFVPRLHDALSRRRLAQRDALVSQLQDDPAARRLLDALSVTGVEWVGDLTSPRRRIGLILLSGAAGRIALGEEEIEVLDDLLGQAAIALETSQVMAERTRQAELERELEIASAVQAELLPRELHFGKGWSVAAVCRAARHVGGDFYTELPAGMNGHRAIVFGDVAGKSVTGALVMMAAHEALQTLAMTHRDPATLFELANRRLYAIGPRKSFVALAYIAATDANDGIDYLVAGQPQLLLRSRESGVRELPLPAHRLPLGALLEGRYQPTRTRLDPGDVVLGYSDGVTEALSPDGEPFGDARLADVFAHSGDRPDEIVEAVLDAVAQHTRGADPYDDITLVAIARDPEAHP
ncbi:MAG TPA: SpoIIE family protein phosphatase [Thermoanaerobaculia bacterium]|nr:SpoIIE family protein phosphatase [Thermoanaerobaculia bacterium]